MGPFVVIDSDFVHGLLNIDAIESGASRCLPKLLVFYVTCMHLNRCDWPVSLVVRDAEGCEVLNVHM